MDAAALFSKKNLLLGGGAVVIITLIGLGIKILTEDPTRSTREQYKSQTAGGSTEPVNTVTALVTGLPVSTATPAENATPAPRPEEISLLPDGAKPVPDEVSEKPGVVITQVEEPTPVQPAQKKNLFTTFPDVAVPTTITDGSLASRQTTNGNNNVQTVFRTAPGRYLFNNLSPDALGGSSVVMDTRGKEGNFNPSTFSPMGETIQLAMLENATTENTEVNVMACVWEPFYFQGNRLLDIGDKLIGTAAPGKKRDRMVVSFSKIIFKDGRSIPVNAVAQDIDGTLGVKGVKIGDVMLNSIAPLLLDTVAAFGGILQQYAAGSIASSYQQLPSLTGGSLVPTASTVSSTSTTGGTQQLATGTSTTGMDTMNNVYQQISKMLAEDVEENKPYLLVPAGTRLQAFLRSPLDISQAGYGK